MHIPNYCAKLWAALRSGDDFRGPRPKKHPGLVHWESQISFGVANTGPRLGPRSRWAHIMGLDPWFLTGKRQDTPIPDPKTPRYVYSRPKNVYSRPNKNRFSTRNTYSRPENAYSRPGKRLFSTGNAYSRPENACSRPDTPRGRWPASVGRLVTPPLIIIPCGVGVSWRFLVRNKRIFAFFNQK